MCLCLCFCFCLSICSVFYCLSVFAMFVDIFLFLLQSVCLWLKIQIFHIICTLQMLCYQNSYSSGIIIKKWFKFKISKNYLNYNLEIKYRQIIWRPISIRKLLCFWASIFGLQYSHIKVGSNSLKTDEFGKFRTKQAKFDPHGWISVTLTTFTHLKAIT